MPLRDRGLVFDACIDHRAPYFTAHLAAACPKGIDVYFETVGGRVFEAVFPLLVRFARFRCAGDLYVICHLVVTRSILLPHLMRAILTSG